MRRKLFQNLFSKQTDLFLLSSASGWPGSLHKVKSSFFLPLVSPSLFFPAEKLLPPLPRAAVGRAFKIYPFVQRDFPFFFSNFFSALGSPPLSFLPAHGAERGEDFLLLGGRGGLSTTKTFWRWTDSLTPSDSFLRGLSAGSGPCPSFRVL